MNSKKIYVLTKHNIIGYIYKVGISYIVPVMGKHRIIIYDLNDEYLCNVRMDMLNSKIKFCSYEINKVIKLKEVNDKINPLLNLSKLQFK